MKNLYFSLTLNQLFTILLCLAGFVLLIFSIILIAKLIKSVNKLNKILDDTSTVSGIAAEGAVFAKTTAIDISNSVKNLTEKTKNSGNVLSSLNSIVTLLSKLKQVVKK